MKKVLIRGLMMALGLTLFSGNYAFAAENNIAAPEHEVDVKLIEMGYDSEEVEDINYKTKKEIVNSGGEKADFTIEDVTLTYHSLDGAIHEVTEDNKKEIAKLEKQDRETARLLDPLSFAGIDEEQFDKVQPFSSGYNGRAVGDWSGSTYISKVGSTSTNNIYQVWTEWNWINGPMAWWATDTVATAWDSTFQAKQNSDDQYRFVVRKMGNGSFVTTNMDDLEIEHSQYGHQAQVPIGTYIQQSGGISEKLLVKKSVSGTKSLVTHYAHPTTPLGTSASIGPISIDFSSFTGYNWSYRININL
ncbi:hypothetical protein [Gracilibacillus sp. Marseille-QA3620]